MTRELARGLLPVASEAHGLMSALEHWAAEVSELFHVDCRFECCDSVSVHEEALADHLYRLAQEAVTNAIKHGRAGNITIRPGRRKRRRRADDPGRRLRLRCGSKSQSGLGLRIMNYRAKMISGSLSVQSSPNGGTVVRCLFPIGDRPPEEHDAT